MPYNNIDAALEYKLSNQIKQILGEAFIRKDVKADMEEATDFAVFTIAPFKVGVRLRRCQYYHDYSQQITIRWSRPSGAPTEIDKIRKDLVQFIMYGFVDLEETRIIQYIIINAKILTHIQPFEIKPNNPLDSYLAIFNRKQIPEQYEICFWRDKKYTNELSEAV